jgi:hypothetical protein
VSENPKAESENTASGGGNDFLFSQRWLQLGWGFGLAMLLVVGLGWAENGAGIRRDEMREVTGLGDTVFFHPPSAKVGEEVAVVSGRVLILAESREYPQGDLEMRRIATDKKTGISVYQRRAGNDRAGIYYLRLSPGVYLKVHLSR